MDTSKIVGEKIKSLRENKGISIEELAERSGLAIEQIERIENNIDLPSLAPLIKIARVLGVRLGNFPRRPGRNRSGSLTQDGSYRHDQLLKQRHPFAQTHAVSFTVQVKSRPPYGAVHHRCSPYTRQ